MDVAAAPGCVAIVTEVVVVVGRVGAGTVAIRVFDGVDSSTVPSPAASVVAGSRRREGGA